MTEPQAIPKSYGVLLYPYFEVLDIAGPIEALNTLHRLPGYEDMTFSYIAQTKEPVIPGPDRADSFTGRQLYLPTHTFADAPQLDVLLVPGGMGTFDKGNAGAVDYVRRAYHGSEGGVRGLHSLITVCTGAGMAAQAGVLDGRRATTNKAAWSAVTPFGRKTFWVAKARWVRSGNVWTTSGVSAGTDGMIAWMASVYPWEVVDQVVAGMEYNRVTDPDNDPFASIHACEDVPPKE